MNTQSVNLNIRYDWPIWDYRINVIYSKTDGWIAGTNRWFNKSNEGKYIVTSLEPSGLNFYGQMEDEEWNQWLADLKRIATEYLGTKIGEIELGEIGDDFWSDKELGVISEYAKAHKSKNHDDLEKLFSKQKVKLSELEEIEIDKWLFRDNWHHLHDSIAASLQQRKHPLTARFIYNEIIRSKIPEFDYKPISRRLTWALADIGTIESREYLEELSKSNNSMIQGFAQKRLDSWENEIPRKGRMILSASKPSERIKLQNYSTSEDQLPQTGNIISAYQFDSSIIVYQAYNPSIASYAVENQKFGGSSFSFGRMTWVKPNYLWMMHRSGWAVKDNQERILAIRISKVGWEELLKEAVFSSYKKEFYPTESDWRSQLEKSEVRLQWDPNHDPHGNKIDRKAIQIGIKGELLKRYNNEMIESISDITRFVNKQRIYVEHDQLQHLEVPIERIYEPNRKDLKIGVTGYNK